MKTSQFKRRKLQNKNMGFLGGFIGIFIGLLIYLGVFSLLISIQLTPEQIESSGGFIMTAFSNLFALNQFAIFILFFCLIAGSIIGFLVIPM